MTISADIKLWAARGKALLRKIAKRVLLIRRCEEAQSKKTYEKDERKSEVGSKELSANKLDGCVPGLQRIGSRS